MGATPGQMPPAYPGYPPPMGMQQQTQQTTTVQNQYNVNVI